MFCECVARFTNWLTEQEEANQYIVFEADREINAWTQWYVVLSHVMCHFVMLFVYVCEGCLNVICCTMIVTCTSHYSCVRTADVVFIVGHSQADPTVSTFEQNLLWKDKEVSNMR